MRQGKYPSRSFLVHTIGVVGERRKILTFQQHSPSMYTENNHRAIFQDWKTVREKNPSLLVVLLTGRSWIRGISTVEGHESEGETPAVGSQGKRNSPFELTNVE